MTNQKTWTKIGDGAYQYKGSKYSAIRREAYRDWVICRDGEPDYSLLSFPARRCAGDKIEELLSSN